MAALNFMRILKIVALFSKPNTIDIKQAPFKKPADVNKTWEHSCPEFHTPH